jgi:hypothetical protein
MISLFACLLVISAPVEFEVRIGKDLKPNHLVRLISVVNGEAQNLKEARTNSKGRVRFDLPKNAGDAFVGLIFVGDEPYYSAVLNPTSPPRSLVLIQGFEASNDKSKLSMIDLSFAFLLREDEQLEIEESFVVRNAGQTAVQSSGPKDEIFRLTLPSQVFNFRYGQGFDQQNTRVEGNDLIFTGQLPPGDHFFSMNYEIDESRFSYEMKKAYSLPISRVDAFLNQERLRLPGFTKSADKKFYAGRWGQTWTKELPKPQKEFSVKVGGLPARIPWTWWLPYVCLFFFLSILLVVKKLRPSIESSKTFADQEKAALLDRLIRLRRQKEKALISSKEYENKRLSLLEQLVPHYSQENDSPRPSV